MRLLLLLMVVYSTSIFAQREKKGGYIYGWDNYTNNTTDGLGPRVVEWDSTNVAQIKHAPEIGIHPRVYFGPSEMPDIINRLNTTTSGNEVKALIHAYTTLIHLGSSYNQNGSYARDSYGNRYIDNSGAWNMEPYYTGLKNEDPNVWDGVEVKKKHRTAALMSMEAFMCLLYQNDTDSDVNIDYVTRSLSLGKAMTFWANLVLGDASVNPTGQNFNQFGGTHMALCYDLIYNYLTTAQRDTIRQALVQILPDVPRHGGRTTAYANTSNWSTLNSFEIIINLAIEGETGYKTELTNQWMRALHNFINYGWYPSGAGYEGLGKNYQFVTTLIACSKRGYSLLGHPHVRSYGEDFLTAIMQPFGKGYTSYDVWGGSGYSEEKGQYKFNSSDAIGLKWVFPESEKIDFVWRNYIDNFHQNDSEGYVYAQVYPDDSYNNYLIPAAVFALNYSSETWQNQANTTIEKDYVATDRGLAVFKSSTDVNALSVQFHARQDMGGHTHGDRLDFTLSGLGRIWIRKTFGGSQFQPSKYHSMVLVNDLGVAVGDPDGDKSRQPATILNFDLTEGLSKIAADATYPYSWDWHWSAQNASNDHPWLGNNGWEAVTETWNDFQFINQSEAHFNIPLYDYGHWTQEGKLERMVKRAHNPMEKVVRNIGLFRGTHPMVLVVDDVKKDENVQNYKWTAQIARDLEVDSYDVNLTDTNYKCDIIFKEPVGLGNRRLLIRILENTNYDGTTNPGEIELLDYVDYFTGATFNPNPNWDRSRLIVESNSISPNFKVLLFPYTLGEELPVTNWNNDHSELEVLFSDEERTIAFSIDEQNNTQFELSSSLSTNENILNTVTIFPNPTMSELKFNTNSDIKSIKLFDFSGKLLKEYNSINETTFVIETKELVDGFYFAMVTLENGLILKKKIIKK